MSSSSPSSDAVVRFVPLSSAVDVVFWHKLGANKLERYKLSEEAVPLSAGFSSSRRKGHSAPLSLDADSFVDQQQPQQQQEQEEHLSTSQENVVAVRVRGELLNVNRIETFKALDKAELIKKHGRRIWDDIASRRAEKDPTLLSRFVLLTFADLKKHRYYHWFAFPAVVPLAEDDGASFAVEKEPMRAVEEPLVATVRRQLLKSDDKGDGFFIVDECGDADKATVRPLAAFEQVGGREAFEAGRACVGFVDPSGDEKHAGWPLRNLLALCAVAWRLETVAVLCFRDSFPSNSDAPSNSRMLRVRLARPKAREECKDGDSEQDGKNVPFKTMGWERNAKGKLGPRLVDLKSMMDPKRLASTSVDLNLRLMRWRILPSLDLATIAETKCLLLGAGTLGCGVARSLLGWGVRNITLVDNGRVSYSNPVRQSLYSFADCSKGGVFKATAAAQQLERIFPGTTATGHVLSIPMPGHAVNRKDADAVAQVRANYDKLDELVRAHDVVFLLTDSRESRWLPSVLGALHDKMVLNVALGFDNFVVMRHGRRRDSDDGKEQGGDESLGCYFCNDVVAPTDSLKERTLDQQCTVTRPGLAPMASALAVELMVSLLHHPQRHGAPADLPRLQKANDSSSNTHADDAQASTPLGFVPHQLRGFLSQFNILPVLGRRFNMCTACSEPVQQQARERGFDLLLDALNTPMFLEDLTGLTTLKQAADAMDDWDDDDIEDEDGEFF